MQAFKNSIYDIDGQKRQMSIANALNCKVIKIEDLLYFFL